nr:DUF6668 family protein [Corynebacterium lactis]
MGAVAIAGADDFRQVYLREDSMLPISAQSLVEDEAEEPAPAVWLVGAHGGAGATTLAHVLAPMGDAGCRWPAGEENPYCAVVCRSTAEGLERAHQAALQARAGKAGDIVLLGIIIVDDAPGRTPKALERKISVISEHFRIWRIPYLEGIRVAATDELAVWEPGYTPPETGRRFAGKKTPPVTDAPAAAFVDTAESLFASALEAYELAESGH